MEKKKADERPIDNFTPMYVALMILLMAFFIVLNSIATPSEENKRKALASLIGTFGVEKAKTLMRLMSSSEKSKEVERMVNQQMDELGRKYIPKIMERIEELAMAEHIDFSVSGHNIEITIDSKVIFAPGEAKINPNILPVLNAIGDKIADEDCPVIIEGHTDSKKISGPVIRNNWDLSTFRAASVAEYLIENFSLSPYNVAPFGFGDTKPIAPNDTSENRAKNRRVHIVLVKTGAMAKSSNLKSWWERIGLVNPFDHVKEN